MSYLGFPRLHFSGRFQANPSTVNNDPAHFNDATFRPHDQLPGPGATNGWWNPRGTGSWTIGGCAVRSVCYRDQSFCDDPNVDAVVGMGLHAAEARVSAKLVDLDPEQQMVSEIWGLQLNLGELDGVNGFRGGFEVIGFSDIWVRFPAGQPDSFFSAVYQSIISGVRWSERVDSRFLRELARGGKMPTRLSIKFTVDGYNDDRASPDFTWGRIVGVIGPYQEEEPKHFVAGRLLRSLTNQPLNDAPFVVDAERGTLLVDLGNSMPTTMPGGPLQDIGPLCLAICPPGGQPEVIGPLPYLSAGWYEQRAGIQSFALTDAQLAVVQKTPVGIVKMVQGKVQGVLLAENAGGWYVRADNFVYRLNADESKSVDLFATVFGVRAPEQRFDLHFDNASVDSQVTQGPVSGPPAGMPESKLVFPATVTTNKVGKATFKIQGKDPGNPRGYIDGQVYGVGYDWHGVDPVAYNANPTDIVSVLVWDAYPDVAEPTWLEHVQPIFQQYANLYPVMRGIVDLASYQSVIRHIGVLRLVFGLPVSDPNYMPVTRDLSDAKRAMIVRWLDNPLYMCIRDVAGLRQALQTAIELEHSTIPTYLCALYSIKPGHNQEVAQIIHSVVREEMLHMALASNLLNAIGGHPKVDDPAFVPTYPTHLPGGLRPDLVVTLKRCSIAQIRDVFMSIEEPDVTSDPLRHHGLTIGWFYEQISDAFVRLSDQGNLFVGDPRRQVSEWWGRGKMITVRDLASAQAAIHEIVEQGEGASPFDPRDGYAELAHFYKFSEIVHGRRIVVEGDGFRYGGAPIPFDPDGVWPMMDNPATGALPPGSQVRFLSEEFNRLYGSLLRSLHEVFNGHPEQLNAAIGVMFSLDLQAQVLMQTPVEPGVAETAGPSFQYPSQ